MGQINIGYLVHSLNPGGTERLALDMALWFSRWYKMHICCLDEPGQWAESATARGLSVTCLHRRPGIDTGIPLKLAAWVRRRGIDLIHAHQYTPWFYAGLGRLLCPRTKVVFQEHGRHYPEIRKLKRILFNRLVLAPMTGAAVAVSLDIRRRLVFYEGLKESHIRVIYNGAHSTTPVSGGQRIALRTSLGFGLDDMVVAWVGRLDPVKNLDLFLAGIARAAQRVPQLKGLVVGDGPEAARIQARARALGLTGRVVFTGFREDAIRLIQAADLFALVSFSEGTSMALLEAMAAGRPAIVTRVGGNPEIVQDGRTGWVVDSDDPHQFTHALCRAALDPEKRDALGRAGQKRFVDAFEFTAMTQAFNRLYKQVLNRW